MSDEKEKKSAAIVEMDRRTALARLGIAATLAYSAPTVLHLDRSANATLSSTPGAGGRRNSRWCRRKDRDKDRGREDRNSGRGRDRDDDRRSRSSRRGK